MHVYFSSHKEMYWDIKKQFTFYEILNLDLLFCYQEKYNVNVNSF